MNKYQEALNNVKRVYVESNHYDEEDIRLLQELVDKETTKKFKKIMDYSVACPNCGHHLDKLYGRNEDYCSRCGQKLDWSKENE